MLKKQFGNNLHTAEALSLPWFPKSWTTKDIRRAGEHVAGLKRNRHVANGQKIYGVYKGVRVGVKQTEIFPLFLPLSKT